MKWSDGRVGDALSRVPWWERIGILIIAALLLGLVAIVGLSPSTPSQVATGAPLPTVIVTTSTTRSAGSGGPATTEVTIPPTTQAIRPSGSTTTTAPSSSPGGCVDPDTCQTGATIVDRGLRTAQPAELAAIAAAVPPPPGQEIDSVMISVTSPTWAMLHVAPGALTTEEYVLIEVIKGKWTAIDSGYPRLRCNQAIPSAVLIDLGAAATLCP